MLSWHDPETKEFRQQRYRNACEQFNRGQIGEATFRALLSGLGFRGQAISSEVFLHEPKKETPCKSNSGLP